jgi:hypothetical protein
MEIAMTKRKSVPTKTKQSKFLDERELANRWGVSVKTLQTKRQKGAFVDYHDFCGIRYRLKDIKAFEQSRRRRHTSDLGPEFQIDFIAGSSRINLPKLSARKPETKK